MSQILQPGYQFRHERQVPNHQCVLAAVYYLLRERFFFVIFDQQDASA
jgi:hypothetical protein